MIGEPLPHVVRPAGPADLAFVGSSWVQGIAHAAPWSSCERCWIEAATRALSSRLMRIGTVLVACGAEDAAQLFGGIVGEPARRNLHWVYTKATPDFRRLGVGTSLMRALFGDLMSAPIRYSARTSAIPHYHARWNLEYAPSILDELRR